AAPSSRRSRRRGRSRVHAALSHRLLVRSRQSLFHVLRKLPRPPRRNRRAQTEPSPPLRPHRPHHPPWIGSIRHPSRRTHVNFFGSLVLRFFPTKKRSCLEGSSAQAPGCARVSRPRTRRQGG